MWRYFKAAFLVGVDVPGLGRLPVNALAAAAFAIVGFAEPSLWLAGLGAETAVVSALAFNQRFQRLVDARDGMRQNQDEAAKRAALVASLHPELQKYLNNLVASSARVLEIYKSLGLDSAATAATKASLDQLQWVYLKLLLARHHLSNELGAEPQESLEARIAQMRLNAGDASQSAAYQRSQQATISLLERRLENVKNRERLLKENDSDLFRIEAQVELMRENAAIEGKPVAVETEIELASDLAAPDLFGAQSRLVSELDRLPARAGAPQVP